ncbi:TPA: terminase, partial [Escherichia coli]|nr:terminase [Escherichia coli]
GDFYEMSNRAQEITASGLALTPQDYKFHFYAWWQDLKYSARVPESGLKLSREKTAYFSAVEKAMNITLTDEQKHWYICKETEQREEMKQEFPSTPQEAFLTSGRRVFSAESTLQAESFCSPPLIVYDIEPVTGTKTKAQSLRDGNKAEQHRTLMNYLLVWELPDPDEEYVCGADTAEGLEHGDRSSLDIIRCSNGEQVAHWFGHLDAELFAHLIAQVCRMYNNAFVGPERNNHGHAVILKLRELYPTRYIYNEQHLDQAYDDDTPRLGWLTTRQSKPVLTEGMKTLLNNGLSGIRWTGTLSEMNTYVYDAKGSMNAQEGCFDDQLMSYMIAQEMRARMPVRVRQKTDKRRTTHWMAH